MRTSVLYSSSKWQCARCATPKGTMMYKREIIYNSKTRDYAMYLDGELIGFARTYLEAETALDQLVFELLSQEPQRKAA
jgi:hypothetical protein